MAEEAGTTYIGVGRDPSRIRWIGAVDYDQLNNAAGSTGTYLNGVDQQFNSGFRWGVPAQLANGAHRGPGELLYFGLKALAVDQMDTSAFTSFEVTESVAEPGQPAQRTTRQLADRVTDPTLGGFADDPYTVQGQIIPILAFSALRPGQFARLGGFARLVNSDQ